MSSARTSNPSYQIITLPNGVEAPQVARNYVNEHADGLDPNRRDDALLLVSELVSNAISHGRPEITLCVRNDPPSVGVAVYDAGAEMPRRAPVQPDPRSPSGRGLVLVDALADQWGVVPAEPPPGKTVWFELGS
jgi:anti-sigma regulatory factor (Ser/Thr protein kinase)